MKLATGIVAVLLAVIAARVIMHLRQPKRPFVPEWVYNGEVEVQPSRRAYPSVRAVPTSLEELRYRVS